MKSICLITKTCNFIYGLDWSLKIHCILEFNQLHWLKPYVKFNTQKCIEAETKGNKDVGKPISKLLNNVNEQWCVW